MRRLSKSEARRSAAFLGSSHAAWIVCVIILALGVMPGAGRALVVAEEPGAAPAEAPPAAVDSPAADRTSDPQAIAVVDAYLKAIGGRDTFKRIQDRTAKFLNVKSQPTGDTEVEIHLFLKRTGEGCINMREEWDVKGFDIKGMPLAFTQIYNCVLNEGWVLMMGTVSPLDGKTLQVFVWDKYLDDFFCEWEEAGYTLKMAEQGVVPKSVYGEDHPCDVVEVTDFSGRQKNRYFFSRANGLLIKKEWTEAGTGRGGTSKREQYFKDYRDLGFLDSSGLSIKFALRVDIFVDGDLDSVRRYTSVEFNSGLSDKVFDKPEGKPFERGVLAEGATKKEEAEGKDASSTKGIRSRRKPGIKRITDPGEGSPEGSGDSEEGEEEGPETPAPTPEGS